LSTGIPARVPLDVAPVRTRPAASTRPRFSASMSADCLRPRPAAGFHVSRSFSGLVGSLRPSGHLLSSVPVAPMASELIFGKPPLQIVNQFTSGEEVVAHVISSTSSNPNALAGTSPLHFVSRGSPYRHQDRWSKGRVGIRARQSPNSSDGTSCYSVVIRYLAITDSDELVFCHLPDTENRPEAGRLGPVELWNWSPTRRAPS
jgi:hypothetical protein